MALTPPLRHRNIKSIRLESLIFYQELFISSVGKLLTLIYPPTIELEARNKRPITYDISIINAILIIF